MWVACRGLRGGLGGWAPRGAVSVFGGFGLVVGVGGGGGVGRYQCLEDSLLNPSANV